jgi:hypothetical protein
MINKKRICITIDEIVLNKMKEEGWQLSTVTNLLLKAFLDPKIEWRLRDDPRGIGMERGTEDDATNNGRQGIAEESVDGGSNQVLPERLENYLSFKYV